MSANVIVSIHVNNGAFILILVRLCKASKRYENYELSSLFSFFSEKKKDKLI